MISLKRKNKASREKYLKRELNAQAALSSLRI